MAFNKTFNQEEIARLKKLITEGDQVLHEVDALNTGLRETVKAIAEEMDLKPGVLMKAVKIAHKAKFQEEYDKFDELDKQIVTAGLLWPFGLKDIPMKDDYWVMSSTSVMGCCLSTYEGITALDKLALQDIWL